MKYNYPVDIDGNKIGFAGYSSKIFYKDGTTVEDNITSLKEDVKYISDTLVSNGIGTHRYGVHFDKTHSTLTRLYDAVGMVARAKRGFTDSIRNDFDDVYPWCECKLCNWRAGSNYRNATITAMENEPLFDPSKNLGAYRPQFYYKINVYDNNSFDVIIADGAISGYTAMPPHMITTNFLSKVSDGTIECKKNGLPYTDKSLFDFINICIANGMQVEDYHAYFADAILMLVEYATFNIQSEIGMGSSMVDIEDAPIRVATSNINKAVIDASIADKYAGGGLNVIFITNNGGAASAFYSCVTGISEYPENPAYKYVHYINGPTNLYTSTTMKYDKLVNDGAPLGSGSGYLGVDGINASYYRGVAVSAGVVTWIAGIFCDRDRKVYISKTDSVQPITIGTDTTETDITLPSSNGFIGTMRISESDPLLMLPTAVDGASIDPIGDYYIERSDSSNGPFALVTRGTTSSGTAAGKFWQSWEYTPISSVDASCHGMIWYPLGKS